MVHAAEPGWTWSGFFAGRLATAGKPAAFFGAVHVGKRGVFAVTTVLSQGAVL